jgi:serine/threonine-protein kinase HipA
LADIIRRYGANDFIEKDLEELFRRMVYNSICSNSDDHLKNHGFLYDQQTKGWRLSPAYDIVPDKNPHGQLGLGVGPYGRIAGFDNIKKGAGRFGLNRDDAEHIIGEICSITQNWQSFFETCGVPKTDIEKLRYNFSQLQQNYMTDKI